MITKYKYLEPKAREAIDESKREEAIIIMMIDGYQTNNEALILRDLLWYARNNEVEVHFVPSEPKVRIKPEIK